MPDVFISYSTVDRISAKGIYDYLLAMGLDPFMAEASLGPGQHWSSEILNALDNSSWVFFLASRSACGSAWVQQELGAALRKRVVPIIWEIRPDELPGWMKERQALDLRGKTPAQVTEEYDRLIRQIIEEKHHAISDIERQNGWKTILGIAAFFGILGALSNNESEKE
jgi:hypothetical protein